MLTFNCSVIKMVNKSHGPRRRTRHKFKGAKKFTVNRYLKEFKNGQKVAIIIDSASQKGMPFRRFYGLIGDIFGKRGSAFLVKIKDGGKTKTVIARPEHLKAL